jgi:hypothetical protein
VCGAACASACALLFSDGDLETSKEGLTDDVVYLYDLCLSHVVCCGVCALCILAFFCRWSKRRACARAGASEKIEPIHHTNAPPP